MFYIIKEKLEYITVCILIYTSKVMPKSFIYKFFDISSILFYKFGKRRSTLTKKNLQLAYPKKNQTQIEQMAIQAYKNIGITLAEIIMLFNERLDIDELIINKDEVIKKLQNITKDAKHGTIFIAAHFSNWEVAAQFLPLNGFPITAVGRKGNNSLIEKNITTPFREKYGNKNIHKKNAILKIVKALKNNKNIGILIDQKASGNESVNVNFFGKPADTVNSIAILKLKYDPIILPIFALRQSDGRYKIVVYDPVSYTASQESDKQEKIKKMTQKYNDILEDMIRKSPEQWFWMHNRWRLS